MSKTIEKMQERLELILNEIGADQTVLRVTLQCFLLNLVGARGPEMLDEMKHQVLGTIERTQPTDDDPQGGERRKQLTLMRAELLFQEIEEAVAEFQKANDPSEPN